MDAYIKKISLLSLIACAFSGCGSPQESSDLKIVGGIRVTAADVITKSTVALVQPDGRQFCTGSLIDARHVLTASHCLADYTDSKLYIAFGLVAQNGAYARARLRVASSYVVHEQFDTSALDQDVASRPPNDIALITLSQAAPAAYGPVGMLGQNDALSMGETLTLAGFGLTNAFFGTSGVLRKVESKLHAVSTIAKEIEFGDSPGRSACMGDSGGPAFVKRNDNLYLVGVTSRGSGSCNANGIYTDVRAFRNWISGRVAAAP